MKKTVFLLFIISLFTTKVFAAPFIVTDPQDKTLITNYAISIDNGADQIIPPTAVTGDTTKVRLVVDVSTVSAGNHTFKVKTINMWGESVYVPFTFSKALPPVPSGIKLEQ